MSSPQKTITHQADEAIATLELFNDPTEPFSINDLQHTLLKTINDAACNESSTLDKDDYFNFYKLTNILQAVTEWQNKYADKGKMLDELYKADIGLRELDEFFLYADDCLQRRKDYEPKREFLLKLWALLSDYKPK